MQILKEQDQWTPIPPPNHIFQISILTWIESESSFVDPWRFARLTVRRLGEIVQADRILAAYIIRKPPGIFGLFHNTSRHVIPWDDLMSQDDAVLEEDAEFPERIIFEREGNLTMLAQITFWNRVGGPEPYHDSVAISISSASNVKQQIEKAILESCEILGIKLIDDEVSH